jgi:hypothetical protein
LCKKSVEDYSPLWAVMREMVDMHPMPPTSETGAPDTVRKRTGEREGADDK